jgi:hypothetical protein
VKIKINANNGVHIKIKSSEKNCEKNRTCPPFA